MAAAKSVFKMLQCLNDKDRHFIEELLLKGATVKMVAGRMHKRGLLVNVKLGSLITALEEYRTKMLSAALAESDQIDDKQRAKFALAAAEQIDAYQEMLQLYAVQKRRVEKLLRVESDCALLFQEGAQELALSAKILDSIVKFELETGKRRRAPTQLSGGALFGSALEEAQAVYVKQIRIGEAMRRTTKKMLDIMDAEVIYADKDPGRKKSGNS